MKKNKIKYAKKNVLPDGEFDPKKSRVRVSHIVDGDVLDAFKETVKIYKRRDDYKTMKIDPTQAERRARVLDIRLKKLEAKLEKAKKKLSYYVNNPSGWDSFSQNVSDVIQDTLDELDGK